MRQTHSLTSTLTRWSCYFVFQVRPPGSNSFPNSFPNSFQERPDPEPEQQDEQSPARSNQSCGISSPESEMRALIDATRSTAEVLRVLSVSISPARSARFREFYSEWLSQLQQMNFDSMSQAGKVDYLLLKNHSGRKLGNWIFKASRSPRFIAGSLLEDHRRS